MNDRFPYDCTCGKIIFVELHEAGMQKLCTSCNTESTVPNTVKLKELSGDKYPHLLPFDKIQKTLAEGEPPFDGHCHYCFDAEADHQIPITFDVMVERIVDHHGGLKPTLMGLKLVAAPSEENWKSVTFPLLLCEECNKLFKKRKFSAKLGKYGQVVALLVLAFLFLYFAILNAEIVAAFSGIGSLLLAFAWAMRLRKRKTASSFIFHWLANIRWVPEMINSEDEYKLSIGKSLPFRKT